MSAKLFMMIGYPGAGKTTTARMLADLTGAIRLSSDEVRFAMFEHPVFSDEEHAALYRTLNYITALLLQKGISVIYDANLNRHIHRQEKYDLCTQTGAEPVVLWLQTPRELSKERAIHEDRSHFAPKGETLDMLFERVMKVFEPATENEHAIAIDGTDLSSEQLTAILHEHRVL